MSVASTDARLLEAWRGGDTKAGSELFARHFGVVYRFFANKVGEEIDDLVQRTFLACVEGRDALREDGSFRSYLLGIARNQLLMHLRRSIARGHPVDPGEISLAAIDPSPSRVIAAREEERLLLSALRSLPLDLQIMVELYYWEDLPVGELADVCGIPLGTVKSRLFRARKALEEGIEAIASDPEARAAALADIEAFTRSLKTRIVPET
jgi:RNA polymerase sigma-70 factor (ECF subfamily)